MSATSAASRFLPTFRSTLELLPGLRSLVEDLPELFVLLVDVEIQPGEARPVLFWCLEQCQKLCLAHIFDSPNSGHLTPLRCPDPGRRGQTR